MTKCPCSSELDYSKCCEPFFSGKDPKTAVELLRSRYTAYAKGEIKYIRDTLYSTKINEFDEKSTRSWSEKSTWHGLKIIEISGGKETDDKSEIEFIASYDSGEGIKNHHEKSIFKKESGKWRFFDAQMVAAKPFKRETPKVGRNKPCPCGSGKKYKKCCA